MNPIKPINHPRGRLITFDGIDGAGKSSQISWFAAQLREHLGNTALIITREPGGTPLGEELRRLVLHWNMHLETEALLMFASRREHLASVIEPALSRGAWVISDRFSDASFAYQGGGRGLALEKLAILEQWTHPHLQPDLTLLFDVPLEIAQARRAQAGLPDQFEQQDPAFFERTRAVYLQRAAAAPQRFRIIDSTHASEVIRAELKKALDEFCRQSLA